MLITYQEAQATKEIMNTMLGDLAELSRGSYNEAIKQFFMFASERKIGNPYQDPYSAFVSFKAYLKNQYAPNTINKKLSAVRKLYEFAMAKGLVSFEQYKAVELVSNVRVSTPFRTWLDEMEAKELFNLPDTSLTGKRDKVILLFLLVLGMRRSEAVSVKWDQIIRRDNMWLIVDVCGKGSKYRTLRIPDSYMYILDEWGWDEGYVLTSVNRHNQKGVSLSARAVNDIVNKYSEQMGVEFSPHSLRRTFSTLTRRNGATIEQIQHDLGHADQRTTVNNYIKPVEDLEHSASQYMEL